MIKKSMIVIVAIVAAAGLIFAAYGENGNDKSTNNSDNPEKQQNSQDNSNQSDLNGNANTTTKTEVSAEKAREIAQTYIKEPGVKTGTPKLSTSQSKTIYIVPIMNNGQQVGEIEIDAQTGENLGGAGGVQ